MIEPGSLIGFGLAFLASSWVASATLCGAFLLTRRGLARLGPAVERVAAGAALVLGPLTGAAILVTLSGHSIASLWFGAADHCTHHGHHPHLCFAHGGAWANEPWAVAVISMVGAFLAIRLAQKIVHLGGAHRALRRIECVARRVPEGALVAPARTPFCFVAGLFRPRVYISSSTWDALSEDERSAVLAHEHAHIAEGDVARRAALGMAALVGAPFLASRVLALWGGAAERLCDRRAASIVNPTAVAKSLVALSRLGATSAAPAGLSFGSTSDVVARVEAILGEGPTGDVAARRIARTAWLVLVSVTGLAAALADPLHHLLETLLGVL